VGLEILPISTHRVPVPLEHDIGEPAVRVGAERDVAICCFRNLLIEGLEDLRRMLVRLLLGGEEGAMTPPAPVAVVDLPDAAVLAIAERIGHPKAL
jgi:hypothetical protein